jgi:hypothetical protein
VEKGFNFDDCEDEEGRRGGDEEGSNRAAKRRKKCEGAHNEGAHGEEVHGEGAHGEGAPYEARQKMVAGKRSTKMYAFRLVSAGECQNPALHSYIPNDYEPATCVFHGEQVPLMARHFNLVDHYPPTNEARARANLAERRPTCFDLN